MIAFRGKGILLDIEGTTSSIHFVYEVLFPYARQHLAPFLSAHWQRPEVQKACAQIAKEAGAVSLTEWARSDSADLVQQKVIVAVNQLMDGDVKSTGLKELQGLIWKEGYGSGELCSAVFGDVPEALKAWHEAGLDVRIYSSGSITAQKQFFGCTEHGNLTRYLKGHYDTSTGPKKEAASYIAIAKDMNLPPAQILFCSDVVGELDAAKQAGMQTALVVRAGNAPAPDGHGHPVITSFAQITTGS